jgi:ring-1,2-phenylacetyl-CoA epoxidase subunit PaaE
LIKTVLKTSSTSCALFFQNRDENSILFRRELDELAQKYTGRFSVMHMLSQPSAEWSGLKGRCSVLSLHHFLKASGLEGQTLHFLCGPEGFMKTVTSTLTDRGVDKKLVHSENFGTGAEHVASLTASVSDGDGSISATTATADDKVPALGGSETWIGDKAARANPTEIEATIDGETHTVAYKGGASVLETLLEAGLNPPYSCMDGACMACMGKVESGLVYQKDQAILSDDNVEAKECLTCQARPAAKKVKINYSIF